jgi:hypothetical protein
VYAAFLRIALDLLQSGSDTKSSFYPLFEQVLGISTDRVTGDTSLSDTPDGTGACSNL